MKVLGIVQFHQMQFKYLPLPEKWKGHLGDVPSTFVIIVFGNSGGGKTEYCVQLADILCQFGEVAWLSYEQGHGADFQVATKRNRMERHKGVFFPIDPNEDIPAGVSLFEDLDNYLSKRGSPKYVFIDSYDYTMFTTEQYMYLRNKYGKKKGIIWISHAKGRLPKRPVAHDILYNCHAGIFVSKYIAYVDKSRFGGFDDLVVYEKRAREKNPLYFETKALSQPKTEPEKPKRGRKKKEVADE